MSAEKFTAEHAGSAEVLKDLIDFSALSAISAVDIEGRCEGPDVGGIIGSR